MSTPCTITGHPETYGLGIRISFYLFWYALPLSTWIARTETPLIRLLHNTLITGTFLGLIIQTDLNALRPVEIYLTILLCFATYLCYVPLYIWRTLTCCQIPFDPARYARVDTGPIAAILEFLLLLAIAFFKLWFWFDVAGDRAVVRGFRLGNQVVECPEYGFFFSRVRLEDRAFVVGHILLVFVILIGCAFVATFTVIKMARGGWLRVVVDDDGRSLSVTSSEFDDVVDVGKIRETALQEFATFSHLLTVSIVLAAVELSTSWNEIVGVNAIGTPAQCIPLVFGVVALLRVVYVWLVGDLDARYRVRRGRAVWAWEDFRGWSLVVKRRRRGSRRGSRSSRGESGRRGSESRGGTSSRT